MNKFEVVLIYSPELANSVINNELEKFKKSVDDNSGKIINQEDWGLRDLSYSINKFKKAFYKFFQLEITGDFVNKIKTEFNQNDNLLRYLFIKVQNHQELPTKLNYEKK